MAFVERIYNGRLPDYSNVEKIYITNAEYTSTHKRLLSEIANTNANNGKFKILRNLFEYILSYGYRLIAIKQSYRRTVLDKCTEMIQNISVNVNIHPKDKIGLCTLIGEVQRICLKYE